MSRSADSGGSGSVGDGTLHKQFDDNQLALQLFGAHHSHLARIEQHLDVSIHSRGNHLTIDGDPGAVTTAGTVLDRLYARIERGHSVRLSDVDASLRMAPSEPHPNARHLHPRYRPLRPGVRRRAGRHR